ncbi:DNA cytosine methyltransferase [Staphylococcus pseudintermedius]|uniref:DNA cytosine methyltransferase n=1 Tax=Staphylococcus pseudintermedius TaxID=283734 RepID=UPI00220E64C1|nr:DNA (cytosine-5-)-methyltransferase [Staphylococcus pseudintermedius]USG01260.1 DNA cytosine methyltransferase [Staphylococcus pseudintermedius]USO10145.1 DNA cytosine methyltransferase [Staphylococcus pseudintermedius]USO11377.1 DNA cytosine methyltransferase [Staphylococcus pseudintermedius]USO11613.1 DNA cytosine methyltransferase [Staphylococcus pseudintermedius]USO12442.1 DNA cytosine methyltransferase [Staphylococcus pseudintermedius]
MDYLVNNAGGIDLIIGGPPCQAYSIAGRVRDKYGMRNDYRNYLFEHYLNVVDRYRPKIFIFENVPGILSAKPGDEYVLDMITKSFKDHGYILSQNLDEIGIINAADYGVPQNRNRLFILGVRKDLLEERDETIIDQFYTAILPKYKSKKVTTVEMAIGDLSPVVPIWDELLRGERKSYNFEESINWHKPRYHNLRDMRIYELLAKDIESGENKYIGAKAITKLYEEKIGSKSPIHRYHVLRKNLPSTTIIAHLYKDGNRFIHYDSKQARTITPRETARLQSFDDDFEFIGTQGHVYKMIGNAVPPKLAYAIGRATSDFLDELLKK